MIYSFLKIKISVMSGSTFKYSFIPHTISQWNAIPAGDDMPQFKSQIKSIDLCHGSTQY